MKAIFSNLRFRTRLALVMFLTMGCTSAILMLTYVHHNRQVKSYVAGQTSDFLQIIQLTQARIPPASDRKQALEIYMRALKDAGLSSITLASPTGEVVASTNPGQVGKKIKLKKRHVSEKQDPIKISAELHDTDVDPTVEQTPYTIEFPIVQGDKVLGYAQIRGEMDAVGEMLRRLYVERLGWIMATMLAGLFAIVYLAFRFTKPVQTLMGGAQQVAKGNLDISLPATGDDELGRLTATFNRMAERLRESRDLQARLNQAEKSSLLGHFAANVAHEVRNSLNFINLSIDQVRAKYAGGEERAARDLQRILGNVKDEIGRLNRLVNDFLAVGRPTPPRLAPCDLRDTLGQALHLVEKQAHAQGIAISCALPDDLPVFDADAGQLKTCFVNILTNAIQAMPEGGEINLTARWVSHESDPGLLELRFADLGPGIPPGDREKIFTPYYSTRATGFGLGLAITRKILEDHGGRIFVGESEG
ncbi:MAG TPA: ATP-binding protein, partial [Terriglobia bacterium]|nr:ATP-binding protein [Terriglobia bacterium]